MHICGSGFSNSIFSNLNDCHRTALYQCYISLYSYQFPLYTFNGFRHEKIKTWRLSRSVSLWQHMLSMWSKSSVILFSSLILIPIFIFKYWGHLKIKKIPTQSCPRGFQLNISDFSTI